MVGTIADNSAGRSGKSPCEPAGHRPAMTVSSAACERRGSPSIGLPTPVEVERAVIGGDALRAMKAKKPVCQRIERRAGGAYRRAEEPIRLMDTLDDA